MCERCDQLLERINKLQKKIEQLRTSRRVLMTIIQERYPIISINKKKD